jgi:HD-like signal output (HDOD) protein
MEKKSAERLAEMIETLKPLPQVATLVVEKCADPDAGVREIADVLRSDPAFTAKVLSVANSVFYRGEKEIKTAKDAVARIGIKALRNIVYSTAVYNLFSKKNERPTPFDREAFWIHSLSVAVCAKQIAARLDFAEDEAFTAGLLHDIGKIVIDQASTEAAGDGRSSKLETVLLEDDDALVEGFDPAEVGYRAAQKWHLPSGVQKAIAYIRVEDLEFIGSESDETLVRIVQSSNAFCEDLAHLGTPHREFLEAYAARFGIPAGEIEAFVAQVRQEVADAAGLFQLTDRDVHRYFDALSTAQSELSKSKLGAAS